jgi:nucleoside-diphosphate-sugar epimerase
MDVFVTGGTGVLGCPTIERLRAAGHQVRGLARRPGAADKLAALGAEPVRADLFDPTSLRGALVGSDAVLHLATRIPPFARLGRLSAWAENDRIRREGTRRVIDATLASGVSVVVYASVVLVYADAGERWVDARSGALAPPPHARSTLAAEREVARFAEAGRRGISLRLGLLYSPDDEQTRAQVRLARWGVAPVVGPAGAYWPALWADDAARAVVAAAARAPSAVYDVVDDRPLTRAELHRAIAAATGRRCWRLPAPLQRLALGPLADALGRSLRVTNCHFVEATGWQPAVPDARAGWRLIAGGRGHGGAGQGIEGPTFP